LVRIFMPTGEPVSSSPLLYHNLFDFVNQVSQKNVSKLVFIY